LEILHLDSQALILADEGNVYTLWVSEMAPNPPVIRTVLEFVLRNDVPGSTIEIAILKILEIK
jgi:hypothetical protein